jgi:hypothetical protein
MSPFSHPQPHHPAPSDGVVLDALRGALSLLARLVAVLFTVHFIRRSRFGSACLAMGIIAGGSCKNV